MAHEIFIEKTLAKQEKYKALFPQLVSLVGDEPDDIANMANLSAVLKATFEFLWVGFYRVKENELVLGPFQGPAACTRIAFGKGVCGSSWEQERSIIVKDVHAFPGHIACSPLSQSEIVIPVKNERGEITALLDIDSKNKDSFDQTDQFYLEKIAALLTQ